MKNILIAMSIFVIIIGCNSSQPKPIAYQSKTAVNPQKENITKPKIEEKQESQFDIAKKSCLYGNAQGCINIGYMLIDINDYKLAKDIFNLAYDAGDKDGAMRGKYLIECIEKNAESCGLLGYLAKEGKGGNQDYKLARVAYQQAINLGNTQSLGSLAYLYDKGLGGEKSDFKATKLYQASCNAGITNVNYEDCYNTAIAYQHGKGIRQNNFKAVNLYRKACNGGIESACNNLGYMYC